MGKMDPTQFLTYFLPKVKGSYESELGEERLAWGSIIWLMREYVAALEGEVCDT